MLLLPPLATTRTILLRKDRKQPPKQRREVATLPWSDSFFVSFSDHHLPHRVFLPLTSLSLLLFPILLRLLFSPLSNAPFFVLFWCSSLCLICPFCPFCPFSSLLCFSFLSCHLLFGGDTSPLLYSPFLTRRRFYLHPCLLSQSFAVFWPINQSKKRKQTASPEQHEETRKERKRQALLFVLRNDRGFLPESSAGSGQRNSSDTEVPETERHIDIERKRKTRETRTDHREERNSRAAPRCVMEPRLPRDFHTNRSKFCPRA